MRIYVEYLVDGKEIRETAELTCANDKDSVGQAVIDYARGKGYRHFPRYRVIEGQGRA